MRRIVKIVFLLALILVTGATTATIPANAKTAGCYGANCNGKNPSGLCDDGITVAAKAVTYGMLELRYSRACAANWGRYTPYGKDAGYWSTEGVGIWARVTIWNPGNTSYGTAKHGLGLVGSSWSQMTDGRGTACTGVEVYHSKAGGNLESQGWNWGPCV